MTPLNPLNPLNLDLGPHPEGGWYRETWRSELTVPSEAGPRSGGTAILFLLEPGQASAWHRIRSSELWMWQGGGSLLLSLGGTGVAPLLDRTVQLGPGSLLQHVVAPGEWQAARPATGEAVLSGCVVVPGFDFDDFELET